MRVSTLTRVFILLLAICALSETHAAAQQLSATLAQASQLLANGEVDRAIALAPALSVADGHLIRCRAALLLEHWDEAVGECEKSVKADGNSSIAHMWLGRALGEKASRANFMSAYSLGKRVRSEFEEAVRLDANNADALADLCEFYYDAPAVVGGGTDKAEQIAAQLEKLDAGRGVEMRARIQSAEKHYDQAEQEFKRAISVAAHPAYQWVSLASFYRQRERWNEMELAIQSAAKAAQKDPKAATALYDAASNLLRTKRDNALAEKLLSQYLASNQKTEQAPAFVAHTRLAELLDQHGDHANAEKERSAALGLAHEYKAAQKH